MRSPLQEIILTNTARVSLLNEESQRALRGERQFGVEEIRRLREPLAEMAAIVARAAELRKADPELAELLAGYKRTVLELQSTLEKIHVSLLTQKGALEKGNLQLAAASRWLAMCRQTN